MLASRELASRRVAGPERPQRLLETKPTPFLFSPVLVMVAMARPSVSLRALAQSLPLGTTQRGVRRVARLSTSAAPPAPQDPSDAESFAVQIRNPTALLNAIASTYKSMPRILMEYVDNALDSAEEARQTGILAPDSPIDIRIDIDAVERRIWIRDNCAGMDESNLMQLVLGIGDSRKRDLEYTNGQFGFGAHAFRAAAEHLHVYTCPASESSNKDMHAVVLDRRSSHVPRPRRISMEDLLKGDEIVGDAFARSVLTREMESVSIFPGASSHGTVVGLLDVDPVWFESVRMTSLCREIENHFEGLLSDNAARIVVGQVYRRGKARKLTRSELECSAFDYSNLPGTRMNESFHTPDGSTLRVDIVVTSEVRPDKRVRFFKGGRAISEAFRLASFMDVSTNGSRLWEHPGVCGRIEVGRALSPVLTRDEFVRTSNRKFVYEALMDLEDTLLRELNEVIRMTTEDTLSELENTLLDTAADLLRMDEETFLSSEDLAAAEEAAATAERDRKQVEENDSEPESDTNTSERVIRDEVEYSPIVREKRERTHEARKTRRKSDPLFEIRFVHAATSDPDAVPQRSFMADKMLYMNVDHEDFRSRLEKDRNGNHVIGPRLTAYLSNEIAVHHRLAFDALHKLDRTSMGMSDSYERLVASINNLENKLTPSVSASAAKKRRIPASGLAGNDISD
ncbi:Hypothetical Protein FCC1311_074902 [Hondaea fermentalgiana]|uniref:Uncharacterized protein n=1 Tax=Hondaea fermentalgiana TaxID=2315210 RepID=A0A2R5GLT1_9STRA|nr:Hypothetical Protein FCC1311_074902 [Hondaea fermentalgiana]|eukprot:GBG31269.1 Hypothetical Protein FCC1311_074902 [Hondaea fermentalgiana]